MKIANHLFIVITTMVVFPFSLIGLIYVATFELNRLVFKRIIIHHDNLISKFEQYDHNK